MKILIASILLLSCQNNEISQDNDVINCTCPYPTYLEAEGYKGKVKSVKYLVFDVDDAKEEFSHGRIENYNTSAMPISYSLLSSENDTSSTHIFKYDNCSCISEVITDFKTIGKKKKTEWYEYVDSLHIKKYFRGNPNLNDYTQFSEYEYNQDYQLIKIVSSWKNGMGPTRENTYKYSEEGELEAQISVDIDNEDFEEFPADSTYTTFSDGKKTSSKTYKGTTLTLNTTFDYTAFDSQGNWTEMRKELIWTDIHGSYIIRREIQYY